MGLTPSTDWCKQCGLLLKIVNKFYCLCDGCNFKRTHGGQSRQEVAVSKHQAKLAKQRLVVQAKPSRLVKRKAVRKRSDKQIERDGRMHATYRQINETREPVCEGCEQGGLALSHSHILAQKLRPDLAADPDNIRLHCFGSSYSCHEVWERGVPAELVQMKDFKQNLQYIEANDQKKYQKILIKFAEANVEPNHG